MVQKLDILVHDPDLAPCFGNFVPRHLPNVLIEQRCPALRRHKRAVAQFDQGGLAGARRAGQKVEGPRRKLERHIRQKWSVIAVAIRDFFELDHAVAPLFVGDSFAPAGSLLQSRDCKGLIFRVLVPIVGSTPGEPRGG